MRPLRIDAHQHFWSIARGDYGWLDPSMTTLYRDVAPAELRPILERNAIDATVLVQAAPTEAETRYLLAIADEQPFVRGVVGWTDLAAPDAATTVAALARHPRLKGLRPMLHDLIHDDWVATAPIATALEAMAGLGLVFDALVRPANLAALDVCAASHPGLTIVIDHAAKPAIASGAASTASAAFNGWARAMRKLARFPNVHCKLSGLLTESLPGADAATLRPWVDVVLEHFGADRLIWGSDWPVLTLAASYDQWVEMTSLLLSDMSAAEQTKIMGANALRVYRLEGGSPS